MKGEAAESSYPGGSKAEERLVTSGCKLARWSTRVVQIKRHNLR
jgi:hypothetical protein